MTTSTLNIANIFLTHYHKRKDNTREKENKLLYFCIYSIISFITCNSDSFKVYIVYKKRNNKKIV